MFDRREFEWTCLSCGSVEYMPGFEPEAKENEARGPKASHGGSRL